MRSEKTKNRLSSEPISMGWFKYSEYSLNDLIDSSSYQLYNEVKGCHGVYFRGCDYQIDRVWSDIAYTWWLEIEPVAGGTSITTNLSGSNANSYRVFSWDFLFQTFMLKLLNDGYLYVNQSEFSIFNWIQLRKIENVSQNWDEFQYCLLNNQSKPNIESEISKDK